jgi:hypothetical protein
MADIGASNWNETDGSNSTAAPDGWPEGMAPSGVNDSGRAMMGAVKRWYDWTVPLVTGGTSTAYTLSYAVAPGALVDGMSHLVQFNAINGASPTLNVNTLGAKPLHFYSGSAWGAWPPNMVAVDQVVRVTYNAAAGTYRAIGMPMVLTQSVLTAATIDFTGIPTNINHLQITGQLQVSNNNVDLRMRTSTSGTFSTGASDYYYSDLGWNTTTGNPTVTTATDAFILLGGGVANSSNIVPTFIITVSSIQAARYKLFNFQNSYLDQAAVNGIAVSGSGARQTVSVLDGIRIYPSAGTVTGSVTVRGWA